MVKLASMEFEGRILLGHFNKLQLCIRDLIIQVGKIEGNQKV